MSELFTTEFDNFRDEDDHDHDHHEHHHHMMGGLPGMMCPMMENSMHGMHMMHPHHSLINTVQHCEITCEHMITMLRHKHDVHMRSRQLGLLHDCADICTLTAKYLGRMSYFSKVIANTCAIICKTCGDECAKFPDAESQHCAQVCHHCARECAEFAKSRI